MGMTLIQCPRQTGGRKTLVAKLQVQALDHPPANHGDQTHSHIGMLPADCCLGSLHDLLLALLGKRVWRCARSRHDFVIQREKPDPRRSKETFWIFWAKLRLEVEGITPSEHLKGQSCIATNTSKFQIWKGRQRRQFTRFIFANCSHSN